MLLSIMDRVGERSVLFRKSFVVKVVFQCVLKLVLGRKTLWAEEGRSLARVRNSKEGPRLQQREQETGGSRKVREAQQEETGRSLTGFCQDFGFSFSFEQSQKPLKGFKQKSDKV